MGFEEESIIESVIKYKNSCINDVMAKAKVVSSNDDPADASIYLYDNMRVCIEDVMDSFNRHSNRFVLRSLIEHGYSLIQLNHAESMNKVRIMRRKYRGSKIELLKNASLDFKLNSMEAHGKSEKRFFQISSNIAGAIRDASTVLMTTSSNVQRAAICHSVSTYDDKKPVLIDLPNHTLDFAKKEKEIFNDSCAQIYAFYDSFPTIEDSYRRIKKNGGKMDEKNLHR